MPETELGALVGLPAMLFRLCPGVSVIPALSPHTLGHPRPSAQLLGSHTVNPCRVPSLYLSSSVCLLFQKDPQKALKDLAKMCILADCTLVLAWR